MPLTEIVHTRTLNEDDKLMTARFVVRKLYTFAELKDGKHIEDEPDDIITSGVSGAYDTARNTLAEWNTEYEWWESALETIAEVYEACGFEIKASEIEFDLERGRHFVIPEVYADTARFLKALQIYLSGVDIRIPLLEYGDTEGNHSSAIKATGTQIRKLDLRSKDARIVKEQGLKVHRISNGFYGSRNDSELDEYYYDGLSDQFREDANEFLGDLAHYALGVLDDELEYLYSDEALLEMADDNDYRFTKTGQIA